jgi:hypothetical protein
MVPILLARMGPGAERGLKMKCCASCGNCAVTLNMNRTTNLTCRRYAPRPPQPDTYLADHATEWCWPVVMANEWCGEFVAGEKCLECGEAFPSHKPDCEALEERFDPQDKKEKAASGA